MDLKDLYRDVIVDHNRNPRNFGRLEPADAHAEGVNPLCGDRLELFVDGSKVTESRASKQERLNLTNGQPLRIGFGETDYFHGKIHEVRVYRRALEPATLQALTRASRPE